MRSKRGRWKRMRLGHVCWQLYLHGVIARIYRDAPRRFTWSVVVRVPGGSTVIAASTFHNFTVNLATAKRRAAKVARALDTEHERRQAVAQYARWAGVTPKLGRIRALAAPTGSAREGGGGVERG